MKPAVLVTDGEHRAALAVVRALGTAGFRVFVCSSRARCLAGSSRRCTAAEQVPDPLAQPAAFADAVLAVARRRSVQVVLPITDAALLAVLPRRDAFGDIAVPFVDVARFRRMSDKQELLQVAHDLGIAVPAQRSIGSLREADALLAEGLRFPVVLKPSRSVAGSGDALASFGVRHAADADSFRKGVAEFSAAAFPLLVQERVVGPGTGVFLLRWDGRIRLAFAHRRLREKPPAGGVSVLCESVALDPALLEQSGRLLEHFDWVGVGMVEFKRDAATGTPYLMEVNGRFWGSLQLAVDAGANFPVRLVEACTGVELPPDRGYRTGLQLRWFWGDADHLLLRLLRSPQALALPPGAAGRGRAVVEFLKGFSPRVQSEIFRWNDPMPFFRESADWIARR